MIATLRVIIYFALPLPEEKDDGLRGILYPDDDDWNSGATMPSLFVLGLLGILCYVGAQEVNATTFMPFVSSSEPGWSSWSFLAIAHSAFAISRFAAALVGLWIKPKTMRLILVAAAIIFETLAAAAPLSDKTATTMLMLVFYAEGPIFPLLFGTAFQSRIRRQTRLSAAMITASIGGGAVFAPISSAIRQASGSSYRQSLLVAVGVFALLWCLLGYDHVMTVVKRRRQPWRR